MIFKHYQIKFVYYPDQWKMRCTTTMTDTKQTLIKKAHLILWLWKAKFSMNINHFQVSCIYFNYGYISRKVINTMYMHYISDCCLKKNQYKCTFTYILKKNDEHDIYIHVKNDSRIRTKLIGWSLSEKPCLWQSNQRSMEMASEELSLKC